MAVKIDKAGIYMRSVSTFMGINEERVDQYPIDTILREMCEESSM